jgi:excisionase family DNA binding protein
MVTADEAARLARVSSRTVYAWVEAGRLHFMEMSDGRLIICLDSIPPPELIAELQA